MPENATVVLSCNWEVIKEREVEVLGIHEHKGKKSLVVVTFKCPRCGFSHQSMRSE